MSKNSQPAVMVPEVKCEPGQIHVSTLTEICGLSENRIRMIAADGYYPSAKKGFYETGPTIVGLLKHFRDSRNKHKVSYDSLESAAAAMGTSKENLQDAKKRGCPGFGASGKIYPDEIIPWLQARKIMDRTEPITKKEMLECNRLEIQIKNLLLKFEVSSGALIARSKVSAEYVRIATEIRSVLFQKLRNELPARLEGLRAPEMVSIMDETADQIVEKIKEKL
jgi:hypothetical protein